jgi:ribosome biogenesis GTPase A
MNNTNMDVKQMKVVPLASTNFAFLEADSPQLVQLGTLAEQHYTCAASANHDWNQVHAALCLIALRSFAELLAKTIAKQVGIYDVSGEDKFTQVLEKLHNKDVVNQWIADRFHSIRRVGNDAVHKIVGNPQTALLHIKYAYELGVWYHSAFSRERDTFSPPTFKLPCETLSEIQKIQELEALCQEQNARLEAMQQSIAQIQAEAEIRLTEMNLNNNEEIRELIEQAKTAESSIFDMLIAKGTSQITDISFGDYESTRKLMEKTEFSLRQIATLIGELQSEPIKLACDETLLPGLGMSCDAAILRKRAEDIHQGIFKIIVIGEFKHGKSTLLNAMLGKKMLPAKVVPTTAVITMLVYGDNSQINVYEANKEEPRLLSPEAFVQEFQLNKEDQETLKKKQIVDRFQHIEYVKVECQYDLCTNGVRLIDSPGLAEHLSRTKVATNFLKQSQAAIFVLNAVQPLTQDEREFIANHFKPGYTNHVFFVVNRINQVDLEEVEDIKIYFQEYIKDYFLDARGNSNLEMCNRRLFFVDAKGALDARMTNSVDNAQLKASGILALEKELEKFLTSSERIQAVLSATFQFLLTVVDQARSKINRDRMALDLPLVELEKRRLEAEKRLQELELKENDIRQTIIDYGDLITERLCSNLEKYLSQMHENWQIEGARFITLAGINPISMAQALIDDKHKQSIANSISKDIQKYLDTNFNNWAKQAPTVVDSLFEKLSDRIKIEISDFARELAGIESFFAKGINFDEEAISGNRTDKLLQLAIALMLGDVSHMATTLSGDGNWFSFIWNTIKQGFIITFISTLWHGPIGWIIFILAETGWLIAEHENNKQKLINSIGKKIHEELARDLHNMKSNLQSSSKEQFNKLANEIVKVLQDQINEVRAEQHKIITQKQDEEFSIEQEKNRLERIGQELVALCNVMSQTAFGKSYSAEQLELLARCSTVLMSERNL